MILGYRDVKHNSYIYDYKYVIIYSSEMAWALLML